MSAILTAEEEGRCVDAGQHAGRSEGPIADQRTRNLPAVRSSSQIGTYQPRIERHEA